MLNSFVKNVFLMMMGVMVALTLYFVFFGQGSWEGLLWFGTRQFEVPCAMHYYEYCYLPSIRQSDGVDVALGGTLVYPNLQATPSDLSNDSTILVTFTTTPTNIEAYWGTSWY